MPWCPSYMLNSMSCEGQEMLGGGWLVDGDGGGGGYKKMDRNREFGGI